MYLPSLLLPVPVGKVPTFGKEVCGLTGNLPVPTLPTLLVVTSRFSLTLPYLLLLSLYTECTYVRLHVTESESESEVGLGWKQVPRAKERKKKGLNASI